MYKQFIRPILFQFQPETIHSVVFTILKLSKNTPGLSYLISKIFKQKNSGLERNLFGLKFPNPVGLAAGLDKDAEVYDMFGYLGFGFVEIGTVTPKAQPGNPKPRLFRIKQDNALINRMGFNNKGVEQVVKNLKRKKSNIIIGGNIGKNKLTPNENAISDYSLAFEALFSWVDYFVINVSSPNTPNLRELQEKEPLKKILFTLNQLNSQKEKRKPILLKIAPDLTNEQLDDIVEIIIETKLDGVVATNTTIERNGLSISKEKIESLGNGGLSGKPLSQKSTDVIQYISNKSMGKFPIIAAGGIMSAEDAMDKLNAGASLVQIYTGFIYEGPALIKKINKAFVHNQKN